MNNSPAIIFPLLVACSASEIGSTHPGEETTNILSKGACISAPLQESFQEDFPASTQDLVLCDGQDGVTNINIISDDVNCQLFYTMKGAPSLTAEDGTEYEIDRKEIIEPCQVVEFMDTQATLDSIYRKNQIELDWGSESEYTPDSVAFPTSLPDSGVQIDLRSFVPFSYQGRSMVVPIDADLIGSSAVCVSTPSSEEECTGFGKRDNVALFRRDNFPEFVFIDANGIKPSGETPFSYGYSPLNSEEGEFVVRVTLDQ